MKHVVRRGDTLHRIARRHGTTVHRLVRMNPHVAGRPHRIYPGERIRVR